MRWRDAYLARAGARRIVAMMGVENSPADACEAGTGTSFMGILLYSLKRQAIVLTSVKIAFTYR